MRTWSLDRLLRIAKIFIAWSIALALLAALVAFVIAEGQRTSSSDSPRAPATSTHSPEGPWREVAVDQIADLVREAEGKIVVVHLWATWCDNCVAELDTIDALAGATRREDVEIVMLSVDDDIDELALFLRDHTRAVPTLHLTESRRGELTAAVRRLGGGYRNRLPYTMVFGRRGQFVTDWKGKAPLKRFLGAIGQLL